MSFERLYNPRGIAVIGASADLSRISGQPIAALKNAGYQGGIYLVNPKYQELHGLKCFPAAAAIKQPCDLALIAVPSNGVAAAVRDWAPPASPSPSSSPPAFARPVRKGASLKPSLRKPEKTRAYASSARTAKAP
jgi:hypothetical protein